MVKHEINDDQIIIESVQKKTKRETIPSLVKLGLTAEQIAEALDLSVQEVKNYV
jgi:predicted transposase/invertase (TIGR01784 family)